MKLAEKTKEIIKKKTGMSVEEMAKMDIEDIDKKIEKKYSIKLEIKQEYFSKIMPRNILLSFKRLLFMKDVNKK